MAASESKWRVLEKYYPHTYSLSAYLDALIPSKQSQWTTPNDSESFRHLLETAVVAPEQALEKAPKIPFYSTECSQSEIMDRVHGLLFKSAKGKPQNILILGYRMASHRDEASKLQPGREGISNYATNSMVETLKAGNWSTLLQRIGEGPMFHLLSSTSIFLDVGNGSFCQATGRPIHELKPLNTQHGRGTKRLLPSDMIQDERASKRRRAEGIQSLDKPAEKNTVSEINLMRGRIFYAKPNQKHNSKALNVGLPNKHILNRLVSESGMQDRPSQEKQIEEDARLVSKYIFPRQYGLHNVFTCDKDRGSWAFRDYLVRDEEIKQMGPTKTPPRLKHVLLLIRYLIHRHNKVHYHAILERKCKSKLERQKEKTLDPSVLLELMSENSQTLPTQTSLANLSSVTGIPSSSFSSDKLKLKPRFAQFICSHREVAEFAIVVTSEVIPKAFWGSEYNWKQVMTNIKDFIGCRRYETISLHNLIQGLKLSEFDWAFSPSKENHKPRRSESDARKGRELVQEFLYWYFDSFLIPLLKTTFYCTESSAFKNQVLFFRQDDWEVLCKPLLDKLCSETFEPLSQAEGSRGRKDRQLGFSRVRLLPKETGVRPIVNLARKPVAKRPNGRDSGSINQILQAAFSVLTFERDRHPDLQGAAILSHNDAYAKLKAFKQQHVNEDGKLPKLYFVKVDVRACFDTIEQGKLLEILRKVIEEDAYTIQRYARVMASTGNTKKTYHRKAIPEDEDPHFLAVASKLAASLHCTVFSDQVVYGREEQDELLELLEEHITSNVVLMGDRFYKQRVGIPQGSVLSTILCGFFYGDMEASSKFKFTENLANLLMRYVDDYLFITTKLEQAKSFLAMMNKGHPEYGCFISREKTVTNFELEGTTPPVICGREILWCGMRINTHNLSVTADYSRYTDCNLIDSLTVDRGKLPGSVLKHKVLQMGAGKSHILYCDISLNSSFAVHLNIYENFLMTGMKMVQYLKDRTSCMEAQPDFIIDIIHETINYNYICIKSCANGPLSRRNDGKCFVRKSDVTWLGYHAFQYVFARKRARFGRIVSSLTLRLSKYRQQASNPTKRFDPVIKAALGHMEDIHY